SGYQLPRRLPSAGNGTARSYGERATVARVAPPPPGRACLRPRSRLRSEPPEDERCREAARIPAGRDAAGVGACCIQPVDRRPVLAQDARLRIDPYAADRVRDAGDDVHCVAIRGGYLDAELVRQQHVSPRLPRCLDHLADAATANLDLE